jgi:hypothetical protein
MSDGVMFRGGCVAVRMEVGVIQIRSQDGIGRGWWFIARGVGAISGGVYSRTIILRRSREKDRRGGLIGRGGGSIRGGGFIGRGVDRGGGFIGGGGSIARGGGSIGRGGLEITRPCTRWHERITIWRPHKHLWA